MNKIFAAKIDRYFADFSRDLSPDWIGQVPLQQDDFIIGYFERPQDPINAVIFGDNCFYVREGAEWTAIPYVSIADVASDPYKRGPPFTMTIKDKRDVLYTLKSSAAYSLHSVLSHPAIAKLWREGS